MSPVAAVYDNTRRLALTKIMKRQQAHSFNPICDFLLYGSYAHFWSIIIQTVEPIHMGINIESCNMLRQLRRPKKGQLVKVK